MALEGRLIVYPSNMGSRGARALKNALGTLLVRPDGYYRPRPQDIIINWGESRVPNWWKPNTVVKNMYNSVAHAINKSWAFADFGIAGVSTVWNSSDKLAVRALLAKGHTVFARKTLTGSQGQGIIVMKSIEDFVDAPLYTKYEKECTEYRVHVAFGQVIDFQQKKKRNGGAANSFIRDHDNGWVFARQDVVLPDGVGDTCVKALAAIGLHFGGVDVLCRLKTGDIYVLEVNTAPGLEGSTLDSYVRAFKALIQ